MWYTLIAKNTKGLDVLVIRVKKHRVKMGLKVNIKIQPMITDTTIILKTDSEDIKTMYIFRLLGSTINSKRTSKIYYTQ